jgi:hypothetical protein
MKGAPMSKIRIAVLAVALAVGASVFAVAPVASAKDRNDVRVRGVCTKSSTSKLKLKQDDRGIEVEFEVDQNRNGVAWKVVLRRNGSRVASGTAVTRGPSGSFEFRRVIAGAHGKVVAIATRAAERCTAQATI